MHNLCLFQEHPGHLLRRAEAGQIPSPSWPQACPLPLNRGCPLCTAGREGFPGGPFACARDAWRPARCFLGRTLQKGPALNHSCIELPGMRVEIRRDPGP